MTAVEEKQGERFRIWIGAKMYVMEFGAKAEAQTWAIKQAIELGMLDEEIKVDNLTNWKPSAF